MYSRELNSARDCVEFVGRDRIPTEQEMHSMTSTKLFWLDCLFAAVFVNDLHEGISPAGKNLGVASVTA